MIYTAINTFYLTDEELSNLLSRKYGIDEVTKTTLRIYGCDLIQENDILLSLYPLYIFLIYVNVPSFMLIVLRMIYTAIDTFYLTLEELSNSPSRKDGIDEATETTLRIYGCDLIQESGILLRLPQAVMATGQVLFHRFYCKKSFARFNVKRVAASCVWLASKLEENFRKGKHVLIVFHKMECRRENFLIEHLDFFSKKYSELKKDLDRTERHLLKEMGFICHVEHPHKFISNYLATLEAPPELRQEAWNLANDRYVLFYLLFSTPLLHNRLNEFTRAWGTLRCLEPLKNKTIQRTEEEN
ncbi:hypothetical protein GIB67_038319 [Kingdonia uniflora]|uniref:Cyclin-like domain-containing protein n=1 Tax=Kingdonia uniflora TaxID=39325 RepID=A0A7J7KUL1_9MAGN|nr:hypothetical protein GIB67_038319 [Kingdonia uniflora]